EQQLALAERFTDQADLAVLEVAEPAVDQPSGPARGARAEVGLVQQQDAEAAHGGVARDPAAVDAGADDDQVERVGHRLSAGTGGVPAQAAHLHTFALTGPPRGA